ncbi:hypothetical protein Vqi01_21670 [Micromonospora qiuiae]|uniref:Methyl-accepting chemotaxis protein n=1 Tax=Micromonospora qiuiae TaxID=502268 RepID=A0ABQ4JAK2_9ACTN|nr:hypothetical protein [Micromonospora qiuiae]GIJ27005.1 hypothetical protein Vqi01_21670 [Micromonospora qiuiae]
MVAVPPTAQTSDDPFENVATLEPNGAEAARKLRTLHGDLVAAGATADAERLLALDRAAARRDYPSLERMLAVEHPLDQLAELKHARARSLNGWRNAAALVPLLLTWCFLGLASWHYHRQITANPELAAQPFLLLWEQRFDGALVPTFAQTAIVAFLMLTLVLVLTVLAHWRETEANRVISRFRARADDAVAALALATETSGIRPPMTAEEWAAAAQRVLGETQRLLEAAVRDTQALAETNNQLVTEGREAVTALYAQGRTELAALYAQGQQAAQALQEQGREFVSGLAEETRATMIAVRAENAQLIAGTTEQAKEVLQQAGSANRQLIEEQMSPLFAGFREALREYRGDHETYQTSAATLASGVTDLAAAAQLLTESTGTHARTVTSIDEHLRRIDESQSAFVARLTENSASMATAAASMREATETMSGRLRTDLEALTRNVVAASTRLAEVDRDLVTTGSALELTTRALHATATNLDRVASDLAGVAAGLAAASTSRGGWWPRFRPLSR